MPKPKIEAQAEAMRLRLDERKSIREIAHIIGVSKGSISKWLRGHPLTEQEIADRQNRIQRGKAPKKYRGIESKFYDSVRGEDLTRQRKMKIAEVAVLFRLVLHGFVVYGSMFDGDKADWVVESPKGKALRIQVKWARESKKYGLPFIRLTCTKGHNQGRRYQRGEFDFIVGYDLLTDTAYIYSFDELEQNKTIVTISDEHAERWDKLRV
jgi:transcriptional regulator with XRE-family HTH domain